MKQLLRFLIVVPTLNTYKILPRLVNSLTGQTLKEWRVLFVDGCSSEEHREWLSKTCLADPRFCWIKEDASSPGIFGAMNQGISYLKHSNLDFDWLLFWGSDDWAASDSVLEDVLSEISGSSMLCNVHKPVSPDLVVCRGGYVAPLSSRVLRHSMFIYTNSRSARLARLSLLDGRLFRRYLFFGMTPPHQATLFSRRAITLLGRYDCSFFLSADLHSFLCLSCYHDISVQLIDVDLVRMSTGGASHVAMLPRLNEVKKAYSYAFGFLWSIPFVLRYLFRILMLIFAR